MSCFAQLPAAMAFSSALFCSPLPVLAFPGLKICNRELSFLFAPVIVPVQTSQAQKPPLPIQSLAARAVDKDCPVETSSKAGPGQDKGNSVKREIPRLSRGNYHHPENAGRVICCTSSNAASAEEKALSIFKPPVLLIPLLLSPFFIDC